MDRPLIEVPPELEAFLASTNPWWRGDPLPPLPEFRRWMFPHALQRLENGLAPVTVLRGPRQVGKTTLQQQIIEHMLQEKGYAPRRIFRVQFDDIASLRGIADPVLTLCRWFEKSVLQDTFNGMARKGEPVFVFLDEVQNLRDWADQIKALVDHQAVRVLLTGSSALRIERGRDSLAGRITTLELGTLLLREIADLQGIGGGGHEPLLRLNGLAPLLEKAFWESVRDQGLKERETRDAAFAAFAQRGGYPMAQARQDRPWEEVADQLNETVIRRVIQHDLRLGDRGISRDQGLLEELFRLCCRYAGQAPGHGTFVAELQSALSTNVGAQRVNTYLRFLNDTLLVRLIEPLELRLKRRKHNRKLCLCDHGLRASWLQEQIPLTPDSLAQASHLTDLAGHIAESILGYYLGDLPGLDVAWFPERPSEPEVDFVLTVGEHRIPLEVKYRKYVDKHRDTVGLRAFLEKTVYNAPFGLLVTLADGVVVDDPRIVALPLSSVLLMR
ncbi:MAG: ATP-binding protein [Armatimonadetes bacterium]|nr:ATP-binding protein [Armatimonadota bacterium]